MAAVAEGLAHLGATARAAAAEAARIDARDRGRRGAASAPRYLRWRTLDRRVVAAETAPAPEEPDRVRARPPRRGVPGDPPGRGRDPTCGPDRPRSGCSRCDVARTSSSAQPPTSWPSATGPRPAARERAAAARVAGAVAIAAAQVLARLERSIVDAGVERAAAESARTAREDELTAVRAQTRELASCAGASGRQRPPRRGRPGRATVAGRGTRGQGRRGARDRPGHVARGVRPRGARTAEPPAAGTVARRHPADPADDRAGRRRRRRAVRPGRAGEAVARGRALARACSVG